MPTSELEYKCRRCGAVWKSRTESESDLIVRLFPTMPGIPRYRFNPERHDCDDKGHGMSDLIGIAPPSEEE